MKTSRNLPWSELKVGIIVIAALALLAAGIIQLGGRTGFFTRNYTLYLLLDNTYGLKVGSAVRLAGLDIGSVEDIRFPQNPADKRIIVTLKLQKRYEDRIRKDSGIHIRTLGLLGDKYVDIEVGSPGSPAVPPGSYVNGGTETQVNRVLSGATTTLEGLNTVLGQLKDILGEVTKGQGSAGLFLKDPRLYNDLEGSAAQIEGLARDLRAAHGSMGKFMEDPRLYDNLVQVSAKTRDLVDRLGHGSLAKLSGDKAFYENLRQVSANLKDLSESGRSLMANLNSGSISRLSKDKELYAKIERISARLDTVTARIDSGQGSFGKLITDEKLYNNMDKFFEDADALVVDVKKNPKKYIHISVF